MATARILSIAGLIVLIASPVAAQYRPIEVPETWTFEAPAPAYDPGEPSKKLGEFQAGITVRVMEERKNGAQWLVAFERYGQAPIASLIDAPNLSKHTTAFARVQGSIEDFPLLRILLETQNPWPGAPSELVEELSPVVGQFERESGPKSRPTVLTTKTGGEDARFWGLRPLSVSVDYGREGRPRVIVTVWNKGDAFQSGVDPFKARLEIENRLEAIQEAFRTTMTDPGGQSTGITAVRISEKVYLLPNDLRVSLRYDSGEYLLLTFESLLKLASSAPKAFDPNTFEDDIAARVATAKDGHRYISEIPMIDQGKKGYCAAATLARVLQFYGYAVDVHAMADLAETEAQFTSGTRGGTLRDDIVDAMKRVSNGTPFRLKEIEKARPEAIREFIERGIPIIWFVPGHARLLIGIHPDSNEIVFSDTWGPKFAFQIGSWEYFINNNQEMWALAPR